MLEPEGTTRVAPTHGRPGAAFGPDALQILTTEHWSLLAARSLVYTEAMSRASIFVASLAGSVVALALVAQATDFGSGFYAFALVLLPVVYFLGFATVMRLAQVAREDGRWVQGMNRIRNAYLQLAPELEPYLVTSPYDDEAGVVQTALATRLPLPALQPLLAIPGIVAVMSSVVAGATAGVAARALELGIGWSLAVAGVAFSLSIAYFVTWARRTIIREFSELDSRFPSPQAGDAL